MKTKNNVIPFPGGRARPSGRRYDLEPVGASAHREDGRCPDGGWRRLSNKQKAMLAALARKAYAKQGVMGMDQDEWRHEVAIQACGVRVSEAVQSHWADLKAAFLDLAGEVEEAFRTLLRDPDNKRRVAMFKLMEALKERGLEAGYAEAICRTQFKVPMCQASAKQIWCLVFTVRNRRKAVAQ